jgi:hypothetical protein
VSKFVCFNEVSRSRCSERLWRHSPHPQNLGGAFIPCPLNAPVVLLDGGSGPLHVGDGGGDGEVLLLVFLRRREHQRKRRAALLFGPGPEALRRGDSEEVAVGPQHVSDEHGGELGRRAKIRATRPIWPDGSSHGRAEGSGGSSDRRYLQPCAWTASFLSCHSGMEVTGGVGAC